MQRLRLEEAKEKKRLSAQEKLRLGTQISSISREWETKQMNAWRKTSHLSIYSVDAIADKEMIAKNNSVRMSNI